ncbi:uncharacterized protein LOC133925358 isoform X2 [Phragmites australis]|uniref:uncharacterized protein LOC133925358 isoform X2 n=1 Tax=Phragmites australis TaxID=29695 RepID=UPI002D7A0852|nr:uncharacterized protein LOC133925358 isoform X2 [Phragmites australis]
MSQSEYKLGRVEFDGEPKLIVHHRSAESSALVAIANCTFLGSKGTDRGDPPPYVEEQILTKGMVGSLVANIKQVVDSGRPAMKEKEEPLISILESLAAGLHVDPVNKSCNTFSLADEILLFKLLKIPLVHGWLSDPEDILLYNDIKEKSYDKLVNLLPKLQSVADEALNASEASRAAAQPVVARYARIKDFLDASKTHLTTYGLAVLHKSLEERKPAVLYIENKFRVVYKYNGDLFTLETDEDLLQSHPDAMWKKLTVLEEESFYVTSRFSPTKEQPNMEKAKEWREKKLSALDEPGDKPSTKPARKKKSRLRRNLGNKIEEKEEAPKSATAEPCPPISNVCLPEKEASKAATAVEKEEAPKSATVEPCPPISDVCPSEKEAFKSPTIAENFLKFLTEFRDGSSCRMIPYFEGVVEGMRYTGSFKLHVPYAFIQKHDGNLAIDIQDEYPRICNELLQSVVTYFCNRGLDKKSATEHAELEILNLREPEQRGNQLTYAVHTQQ